MFPEFHRADRKRARCSSALVVTLASLVLVCALVLIFLNQTLLNRQISFASSGQYQADLLAHTALDTIVGDLRTEIAAGSYTAIYVSGSGPINYIPITNFTAVPCRVASQGFPNLVKQSTSSSNFWTGSYYTNTVFSPVRSAANNSTQTPAANGRYIKVAIWNKPGLLGDPGTGVTPAVPGNYTTPPDWVLITRTGAVTNATALPAVGPGSGTLSDKSSGNLNYVFGRYAYTIYDEGGLFDVNVGGYPSSITSSAPDFAAMRGMLPQANLGNIPGVLNANSLVQWRNQTTAASATTYTNYVLSSTNGFTTVANGDQAFVSRTDLINYAETNTGVLSTTALQYLGTFTRGLNAPSYTPPALGSSMRPGVQYQSPFLPTDGQDNNFNNNFGFSAMFVKTSFQRASDGTTANPGDRLIKYRFPLSRLNWLTHTGPAPGVTAQQIYNAFGLTWTTGMTDAASGQAGLSGWVYNHGNATQILTLAQVVAANREPDFFELLQAGIEVGSLGKSSNSCATGNNEAYNDNTYFQIIQIAANIIDQYHTDSYPTQIAFNYNGSNYNFFAGIKNLPYLSRVIDCNYRPSGTLTGTSGTTYIEPLLGSWFQPEIWNPHQQAATPPTNPNRFKFVAVGSCYTLSYNINQASGAVYGSVYGPLETLSITDPGIQFYINCNTNSTTSPSPSITNVVDPIVLQPGSSVLATGNNYENDTAKNVQFVGIWTGNAGDPSASPEPYDASYYQNPTITPQLNPQTYALIGAFNNGVNFYLQYWDTTVNQWVTYSRMENVSYGIVNGSLNSFDSYSATNSGPFYAVADPRTERFGPIGAAILPSPSSTGPPYGSTFRPAYNQNAYTAWAGSSGYPGWVFPSSMYFGYLTQNQTNNSTYYGDPDGLVRAGDSAYASGDTGEPMSQVPNVSQPYTSRPIMLNRPFRSVAEMGYAFRGIPWKSLDFFTANSGDSALLDLFCLNELPYNPPANATAAAGLFSPVTAGHLDLNTQQQPVLQAVLTGIQTDEENASSTLSSTDAANIATALVNITTNTASGSGPLLNASGLATSLEPVITYTATGDTSIKPRREAAVRALADIGDTRTWNLLVDVIAQSGRYAKTATNLNQFTVEGERRYWLHVCIDRYTGAIIAQSLEAVSE